jgi:hypothetical protein
MTQPSNSRMPTAGAAPSPLSASGAMTADARATRFRVPYGECGAVDVMVLL